MSAYYCSFAISIFICYFVMKMKDSKKYIISTSFLNKKIKFQLSFDHSLKVMITMFPVFLVSAMRYGIGTDYFYTYVPIFELIKKYGNTVRDLGYGLLNVFVQVFTNDVAWIFVLTSFIFLYLTYSSILKYSKNWIISIILLLVTNYFFLSLNAIRQVIAIAIFMNSIEYIKDRNFMRYLFNIVIAATFHSTVLIVIPFYFLVNYLNLNPKKIIILLACAIISTSIMQSMIQFMFAHSTYLQIYFAAYFTSNYNTGEIGTVSIMIAISFLLLMLFIYNRQKNNFDFHILALGLLLTIAFNLYGTFLPLSNRIAWYFSYLIILYLPSVLQAMRSKELRLIVTIGIIVMYFIYMNYTIVFQGYHEVYPYISIFSRI